MPFTNYAVRTFITQRIAEVTSVGLTDLSPEFPHSQCWLTRLGILAVLTNQFAPEARPFAIQFVRRVEMSLTEYACAKPELEALVAVPGRWSPYYRALHHIEMSASLLYQAYDLSRKKLGLQLFRAGDGSSLQRLNTIYNKSKHEPAGQNDPVWLSSKSIHTSDVALDFTEYEAMLRECSTIADKITSSQKPSDSKAADG